MNNKDLELNSELNKLNELEELWTSAIEEENKLDEESLSLIETITDELLSRQKTKITYNGINYALSIFISNTKPRKVTLIIVDCNKFNILQKQYVPATASFEYVEQYDTRANIRTAVDAWVRHITGKIKIEEEE